MNRIQEQKLQQLNKIADKIRKDKIAKKGTIGLAVPGEGNPDARVVFVGEAPGKKEAECGKPFVGRAGKVLRDGLAKINLNLEDVFITSAYKYLPVQVTPTPKQIEHGRKFLFEQLEVIKPDIIVLLGRVAVYSVLNEKVQMVKEHGKVHKKEGKSYFFMLHPAACLHQPKLRSEFFADFKKLKKLLDLHFANP